MSGILKQKLLLVRFGGGRERLTTLGHEGTFCSDGHYLYRDGGGGSSFTGIYVIKTPQTVHLKRVHFISCKL